MTRGIPVKDALKKSWQVLMLLALLAAAALPILSPRAQALPGCGECSDGTWGSGYSCFGAARNCSDCTVCDK
jgi:hypothetical protein